MYADKSQYFVDKLAQGIGRIAAAFYPKPVLQECQISRVMNTLIS